MTATRNEIETGVVTSEVEISAPPERVFRALTNQAELFSWWSKEKSVELTLFEMDARPGGRWRFECRPQPGHDQGAVGEQLKRNDASAYEAHGEVLELDPPRLVVWSWIANWHEHPEARTIVRWELSPMGLGTRVRVTHSGLEREPISRKDYTGGWQGVLQLLRGFFD